MNNFREKLARFMYGRYGYDQLGRFLMTVGFVSAILCMFLRFLPSVRPYYIFSMLNTACYVFAFFRILSRNIPKRSLENQKFLALRAKLLTGVDKKTRDKRDRSYIFKKCPGCGVKLRLRRIKGKHTTQCPKCGIKFNVRIFVEYKDNNFYDNY